jgi:hypothetical protein
MFRFEVLRFGPEGPPTIDTSIAGPVQLTQMDAAGGVFTGTAFSLPVSNFRVQAVNDFGCVGASCPPSRLMATTLLTNREFGMVQLSSLGVPDSAQLMLGALLVGPGPLSSRLDVIGREVSRSFTAPEPSALGTLALGTISLALATVRGRGRRARGR